MSAIYNPNLSVTVANAINEAYNDYLAWNNPNNDDCKFPYNINVPGFTLNQRITVNELGSLCPVPIGFTATGGSGDILPEPKNILIFRETQTSSEGFTDADWSMTPCFLPSNSKKQFGQAANGIYGFYTGSQLGTSLEGAVKQAVSELDPSLKLVIAGHSLGGAIATLAALEIAAAGWYDLGKIELYTYGSLHVGDSVFVSSFDQFSSGSGSNQIQGIFRVANLADWVPAFTGLVADTKGYKHVGLPCTFLWQTDGDWANHSLLHMYLKVVSDFSQVIRFGQRLYPLSC